MKAQHNDVYVSHHKVDGWSERKAYIFKEYVNGPKWIPFTTDYGDYLCGYLPPRYPVPAPLIKVEIPPDNCCQDSYHVYVLERRKGAGWYTNYIRQHHWYANGRRGSWYGCKRNI